MYWGSPHNEVCYTYQGKKPRGQKLYYYYYAVLADCPRASVHSFLYEKISGDLERPGELLIEC